MRDDAREIDVIASTETLDSHGTILRQNWDLSRFEKNPVVFWAHDSSSVPIGTATVNVKGSKKAGSKRLEATIKLRDEGKSARADEVWEAVKDGTVRGVSVGFRSHTQKFEKHEDREVFVLDDNELMEISIVPIPSNQDATIQNMRAAVSVDAQEEKETNNMSKDADQRVAAVEGDLARLLEAVEAKTVDEAVGAIAAARASAAELEKAQTRVAELEQEKLASESDSILAKLKSEGRITPDQEATLFPALSIEGKRAFAACAPKVLVKEEIREPAPADAQTANEYNGKPFWKLTPKERAECHAKNPDLYRAMRQQARRS